MSISSSLSNALSGLTAVSRSAELVSANLANVTNPNYARREIELSARDGGTLSGGVSVSGVNRVVDQALQTDRRHADADVANAQTRNSFFQRVENSVGLPTESSSLTAKMAAFEATLIQASSQPASDAHLRAVVTTAGSVTDHINHVSEDIQSLRMDADRNIATEVKTLTTKLDQIRDLNFDIARRGMGGHSTAALEDHRAALLDDVSRIVPLREVQSDNGQVSLFTLGGTQLLGGQVSEITFNSTGLIVPHMTQDNGLLGGLEVNGTAIDAATVFAGGSLAGHFEVRDELAVTAQRQLDAVARDLISRFEDPAVDPTLTTGDPGFFTDAGAALDLAAETGLAGRVKVNASLDSAHAGAAWRVRDGINASAEGPPGDTGRLTAMIDALQALKPTQSGGFSTSARSLSGLGSDFLSELGRQKLDTGSEVLFATTQQSGFRSAELENGVDTDQEMQKLLLIEQAYSANARVIQTVDEMIDALLRI
ncbi:flagellar hook-associated protein FlgK [Cognatishimia sp. MH4019]|uniref:flagellar hook-associated protein FlgK n=1 Tax=Cognatishimia sp. MH4019 TaxID=2854030 RepID=UPI001CD36393|nr:flagellar hook-associated protein FlgK [Cognatishimia sp. MH4019]